MAQTAMDETNFITGTTCKIKHQAGRETLELHMRTIEARLNGMDEAIKVRADATHTALQLKTQEMDRRLEGLNQLRQEVVRDRDQFLKREMYDDKSKSYDTWVAGVNEKLTRMETRYESRITLATAVSILSIVLAVVSIIAQWMVRH